MIGKVKWFNNAKGYGFILVEDKELFIHYSQIMCDGYKTLSENEEVIVEKIITTSKGYQAQVVRKVLV